MSTNSDHFVELPKVNPKTGEPPKLFICSVCASIVGNRKQHLRWHEKLERDIQKADGNRIDWPPLD